MSTQVRETDAWSTNPRDRGSRAEVSLLTQEKVAAEESVEALLEEISEFEQGVAQLEKQMHQLSKIEAEAVGVLKIDDEANLRKRVGAEDAAGPGGRRVRRDARRRCGWTGFGAAREAGRSGDQSSRRSTTRGRARRSNCGRSSASSSCLLEEQQRELHKIRRRQEARGDLLEQARKGDANALALATAGGVGGGGGGGYSGPSVAEKKQAAQLMQSTETLMKFGFMSMSMTYFSSLNMIRARCAVHKS